MVHSIKTPHQSNTCGFIWQYSQCVKVSTNSCPWKFNWKISRFLSGIGTWQYVKPIFYDVKQELITITSCSNLNGTRKTKHFPEQISKTGGNDFLGLHKYTHQQKWLHLALFFIFATENKLDMPLRRKVLVWEKLLAISQPKKLK